MSRVPANAPEEPIIASAGLGVGPYRLTRRIARGGMGDVWLAQRVDGVLRRPVAVKLMHGHLLEPALETRFRAEREILAALDHPHIARLIDGGVTSSGVPYVAMEYVDGQPIDDYCRHREPSLPERLRLFRQVCDAVHYAHRNLIVHRDVKPGNILVTRDGHVKLLDFGIAKLLRPELGAFTHAVTRPFDSLMTPEYASPEQLRGEPVSTATDIYSLGLLLNVLVTGRLPYSVEGLDTNEIRRIVCEHQPKPLDQLAAGIPPDLVAIVAKALRKEPQARYPSADQLGDDVQRYLDGFPVQAHHGHWSYLAGKFIKRHQLAVAFASVLLAVLIGSGILLTNLTRQYKRERDTASAVGDFLVKLFDASDPNGSRGSELPARALVDRGAAQVRKEFANEPAVEASLSEKLGDVYRQLGEYRRALPLFERSLALEQRISGPDSENIARIMVRIAELLREFQQYDRAEQLAQRSLQMRRGLFGPDDGQVADSLNVLGILQQLRGRLNESRATFAEAVRIRRAAMPTSHFTALSLGNLGNIEKALGNLDTAESLFSEALSIRRKTWGDHHPRVASSMGQLSQVALSRGEVTRAITLADDALAIARAAYKRDTPDLVVPLNTAASAHREAGHFALAESLSRESMALNERFRGRQSVEFTTAQSGLAAVYLESGRLAEAAPLIENALRLRRSRFGDKHPSTISAIEQLAELRDRGGQKAEAATLYAQVVALRRELLGARHPNVALTLFASGHRAAALQQLKQALPAAHNLEAKLWLQWAREDSAHRSEYLAQAKAELSQANPPDPFWQAQLQGFPNVR